MPNGTTVHRITVNSALYIEWFSSLLIITDLMQTTFNRRGLLQVFTL